MEVFLESVEGSFFLFQSAEILMLRILNFSNCINQLYWFTYPSQQTLTVSEMVVSLLSELPESCRAK